MGHPQHESSSAAWQQPWPWLKATISAFFLPASSDHFPPVYIASRRNFYSKQLVGALSDAGFKCHYICSDKKPCSKDDIVTFLWVAGHNSTLEEWVGIEQELSITLDITLVITDAAGYEEEEIDDELHVPVSPSRWETVIPFFYSLAESKDSRLCRSKEDLWLRENARGSELAIITDGAEE